MILFEVYMKTIYNILQTKIIHSKSSCALKIQCHIVKNTLLQTADCFFPTG